MFKILATMLVLGFQAQASATVPMGEFDCSRQRGSYTVSITSPVPGAYFVKVNLKSDVETSTVEGFAVVATFQNSQTGSSKVSLIRVPGTNVNLYFDEQGKMGQDRTQLNCRKTN